MNTIVTDAATDAPNREALSNGRPSAALVVDDEPSIREFMRFALSKQCTFVEVANSAASAQQLLDRCNFDVLVVDVRLPDGSGVDWVASRRAAGDMTPVIFMSAYPGDTHDPANRLAGNPEFIAKPFSLERMLGAVERALEQQAATAGPVMSAAADDAATQINGLEGIIGHSAAMQGVLTLIRRVAGRGSTVLLEGESGTGKEVAARFLHHYSGRRGAFVPVNCGSITAELLESELFGHIKGAFTGATQHREGLFSYANHGTILLDEICEMPFAMQAKLLRVLEERTIRPVGSEKELPIDVRVVAATNKTMSEEVAKGNFREDLFYRLNILALRLPPLRERLSDVPHLVRLFSENLSRELLLPPLTLTDADIRRLQAHCWPGNVRELKNLVERAMLLGRSPAACLDGAADPPISLVDELNETGYPEGMPLDEVEKLHILKVLKGSGGNKSEAARRLGVSRKTLERKVKAWGSR
ncbi:MAG: sigma-54 dependent transcriptional regulator [Aquisalimonadaceae bacterium]